MVVYEKRYFEWCRRTGESCLQNNIAEMYFIMDRSEWCLVFKAHLGMDQIFRDLPTESKETGWKWQKIHAICLLPVGWSVNIWSIPRCAIKKTKTSLRSIHNEVYFCNNILQTTLLSFAPWSFLIDNHCELQSEFVAIVANVRIGWTSFRVQIRYGRWYKSWCVRVCVLKSLQNGNKVLLLPSMCVCACVCVSVLGKLGIQTRQNNVTSLSRWYCQLDPFTLMGCCFDK